MTTQNTQNILHVFYSSVSSCRYVFKDGQVADFVSGMYTTDDEAKIAELSAEIKRGHPTFSVNPQKLTMTKEELDPMYAIKMKLRAELLAEMQAEQSQPKDFGTSGESGGAGTGVTTTNGVLGGSSNTTGGVKVDMQKVSGTK